MKIALVSSDELFATESQPTLQNGQTEHINLFQTLGTRNCISKCVPWKDLLEIRSRKNNTNAKEARLSRGRELAQAFTLNELSHSASRGCDTCAFFKSLIEAYLPARGGLGHCEAIFEWIEYSYCLRISYGLKSRHVDLQLFNPSGCKVKIEGMPSSNLLSGNTCSDISFNRVLKMIQDCEDNHEICGEGKNEKFPRRLLDLRTVDQNGAEEIRLVDTQVSGSSIGSYVCLSHCWGKLPMPMRTTKSTVNGYLHSIAFRRLPLTFQEACLITRKLGVDYIWIDSLCIVQDSTEDWEIESSKMADIYQHSYLTIAAVSSADFRGGCFSVGRGDVLISVDHPIITTHIAIREYQPDEYPLLTRGWVYQERMLSRRILYCTAAELQFECRQSGLQCECGNQKIHPNVADSLRKTATSKDKYHRFRRTGEVHAQWHSIVTRYTVLDLTKPSDKLPALSGCAKDFNKTRDWTYLAGLWRETLCEDLLWVVEPGGLCQRPAEKGWRAPSWSWASVDSPKGIRSLANLRHSVSEFWRSFEDRLIEVSCRPKGKDKTGEVERESAYMRIRSSLVPIYIRRVCFGCKRNKKRSGLARWDELDISDRSQRKRNAVGPPLCEFAIKGLEMPDKRYGLYPDFIFDDRMYRLKPNTGGLCRFTPCQLLFITESTTKEFQTITVFFLVLHEKDQGRETWGEVIYERVALLYVTFPGFKEKEEWFEQLIGISRQEEVTFTLR